MAVKTITLTGTELEVRISGQNCDLLNKTSGVVYMSRAPGIVPDADGVLPVEAGTAGKCLDTMGTVYLLGTGKVVLCGNDYSAHAFPASAFAGGTGGSSGSGGTLDGVEFADSSGVDAIFDGTLEEGGAELPEGYEAATNSDIDQIYNNT